MHISRTKLYSDSVHLFLCNKYVCFQIGFYVDMLFTHDIVVPPQGGVGVGMSGASQSITGAFSSSHTVCNQRQRVTQPHSQLHTIGQGTKTSLSCGSLKHSMVITFYFHFAFRVPYIYACFYNVSFNILMYPLSNLDIQCKCNYIVSLPLVFILSHDEIIYANKNISKLIFFIFSGLIVAE